MTQTRKRPPAFFVQNNYVERLTIPVAAYAREHAIALEDRSSSQGFDPDDCGIDWSDYGTVLPYGSVQFLRKLKASRSLARFVVHDEAKFATSAWAPRFGANALNGSGCVMPAGEVSAKLEQAGPRHLRPDRVDKAFVGGVFDAATWEAVRIERNLADDLACWVSPVATTIDAEWRCWIVAGHVVEISKYREAGHMEVHRETRADIYAAAEQLGGVYLPAPCVVLDMALANGQFSLVEFNPIHCAGWYGADVANVLTAWLRWAEAAAGDETALEFVAG